MTENWAQRQAKESDSVEELWRLIRVWRTRADEEYQRAERAEAAHARAHQQANDALNDAARMKERAEAAEARERALREAAALSCEHRASAEVWFNNWRSADVLRDQADIIRRFVKPGDFPEYPGQQPADQPAQGERPLEDPDRYSAGYLEGFERGMTHAPEYWLERAAQLADQVADFWHEQNEPIARFGAKESAKAIRNLRSDQ